VTGLLDGYQDKRHKLSMYSIAERIGLPAPFVELRHQCTHEELPSLSKLRAAAERSLTWIWEHYWQGMEDENASADIEDCRRFLHDYLRWRASDKHQDQGREVEFSERLKKWDTSQVLEVLVQFSESSTMDAGFILQSLKLSRAILSSEADHRASESSEMDPLVEEPARSLDDIRAEMARTKEDLEVDEADYSDEPHFQEAKEFDVEMVEGGMNRNGKGWTLWEGPWIPKPIGLV